MVADEGGPGFRGIGSLLEFATKVLAPAGMLTAVLYYFGYRRAEALYGYFGLDLGSVGLTTTDYLVRSAGPLFVPLAVVLVTGVVVLILHHLLALLLDRLDLRGRRVACGVLAGLAFVSLAIGAIGLQRRAEMLAGPLFSPVALAAGALLLDYAAESSRIRAALPGRVAAVVDSNANLRRGLIAGLLLVAAFWATAGVAQSRGLAEAQKIEVSLLVEPKATVYSRQRLQISAPGVRMVRLSGAKESAYAFRYDGLRLLAHSRGRWFLLPVGWTRTNGASVVLLPESGDIRVDLAP
ncbi:hypothetical protein Acsp04_11940 [Actinomadura sp. NBRC 104425]|uniref:hypothetical protein n=1 Tax=Actinomadura sp. NBRC 104425 TaxID=3032204 RepID=UPI0024A097D1|nr:hypothetical protein [Actinomadura sp. NBRC 104425]GLZ10959.1 hypothetical protein Acsp04_11940 [Actinomadura sp. NBRC 104425]